MARNTKREYLKKLLEAGRNGYEFNVMDYLYNPAHGSEYPSYEKVMEETEKTKIIRKISYFKYWDGSGEYYAETYELPKEEPGTWVFIKNSVKETLEKSNRFNLKKLLAFCE